jgi:hypothetical protein
MDERQRFDKFLKVVKFIEIAYILKYNITFVLLNQIKKKWSIETIKNGASPKRIRSRIFL